MPTPSPIISASSEEKSGMLIRRLPSPIRPRPVPRPSSAVRIGSPIASIEPKLTSSTMTAAPTPTSAVNPIEAWRACSIACPENSTCSPAERAALAVATMRFVAATGSVFAGRSKATVANAIFPSAVSALLPGRYGLLTEATCGSRATRESIWVTVARVAGAVSLPVAVWSTI